MISGLKSPIWPQVNEVMRKCHLSTVIPDSASEADWKLAFTLLTDAITDERHLDPSFAIELSDLSAATGNEYGFSDILEEYFNHLEEKEEWEDVINSAEKLISMFKWEHKLPSEYKFRIGNALNKAGRYDDAEAFGAQWLKEFPYDLYAAASNVFLKVELKKYDEAEELTKKYLHDDLVCDSNTDTFFMAAFRLFEMTDNINAKQRIEKKIAEYNEMINK